MGVKKSRHHAAEFKAKVALDMLRRDLTVNEISKKYEVHSTQIHRWKQQALEGGKIIFEGKQEKIENDHQQLIDKLYRQIGQLTCENFLKKSVWE